MLVSTTGNKVGTWITTVSPCQWTLIRSLAIFWKSQVSDVISSSVIHRFWRHHKVDYSNSLLSSYFSKQSLVCLQPHALLVKLITIAVIAVNSLSQVPNSCEIQPHLQLECHVQHVWIKTEVFYNLEMWIEKGKKFTELCHSNQHRQSK